MKKQITKRLLSILLVLALVAGFVTPVRAAEVSGTAGNVTWSQVDNSSVSATPLPEVADTEAGTPEYAPADMVRVSIFLDATPTTQVYGAQDFTHNPQATAYRQELREGQAAITAAIEKTTGQKLDVVWNLTLAANVISANVPYGQIEAIDQVSGVGQVLLETRHEPDVVSREVVASPNMSLSNGQMGSGLAWSAGYTGAGSRIAIIDTGTDMKHQSFNEGAFRYSLAYNAGLHNMDVEDYLEELDLLDVYEIASVAHELNISIDPNEAYINSKIPFGYNYVDGDYDVQHINDTQGEHGSHVSGIVAANTWIPNEDGTFRQALPEVFVQGVAPDAQIITLKVFGKSGGAYESDYIAAIEDAIVLGCDAINLSMGTQNPGNSRSAIPAYQEILENLEKSGAVVAASIGNNYGWPTYAEHYYDAQRATGSLYADDVNMMTGGAPGSNTNTMAVASMENDGRTDLYVRVQDDILFYTEQWWDQDHMDTIPGEHEYVFIEGYGYAEDWAAVGDALQGKIAICSRGSRDGENHQFYQKAEAAVDAGAIATIIYNNEPGIIYLDLLWYNYKNPCVSFTQDDAAMLRAMSTPVTDETGNVLYYTGTMTITGNWGSKPNNSDYYTMSRFSSWGVPGSLELKPEITAPGGEILSVFGEITHREGYSYGGYDSYLLMSGTSMAAPQVAGLAAVVAQYIRENDLVEKTGLSARVLAQSLMMSTATPMLEAENQYYPVIRQGSGLANVGAAASADSYILMDENATASWADGKAKAELGDDPKRTGQYTFSFTINNLEDAEKSFLLSADFFTQDIHENPVNDNDDLGMYMSPSTRMIAADVTWTVNGMPVVPAQDLSGLDFNGDGAVNSADGQTLLDYATGLEVALTGQDKADLDADGDIDTHDAWTLLNTLNSGTALIPAGESAQVTVTISLTQETKATIEADFVNGTYIQGYVFAESTSSEEGVCGTSHSIPVLAYYGSWTDPSMYDVGTRAEYLTGEEIRDPYLGSTDLNTYGIRYGNEDGQVRYFGGNPIVPDEIYLPERNAINSENGDLISQLSFTPIRNAMVSRFTVVNETTGKTITEAYPGAVAGSYYHTTLGWLNAPTILRTKFDPTGATEGERFTLTLTLATEYDLQADGAVNWDALGDGAKLSIPVVIDNTAPKMERVMLDLQSGKLNITASDNQYVAAVALYNSSGNQVMTAAGAKQDIAPGETADYTLDLSGINGSRFLLQVVDYAMNRTTYALEMQLDATVSLPHLIAFNLDEGYWTGFASTATRWDLEEYVATDEVFVAATIVDHTVLAATDTGVLYAMPENDLTNTTKVCNLPALVTDMAYNPADGQVYGVDEFGQLVMIDKLTGDMTVVGQIGVLTNTLACDANGTFYCNGYNTTNVYSFTLETLAQPTVLLTNLRYATQYLQSMEISPNDGKLYYASFATRTSWGILLTYGYFYEIDTATGACKRRNNLAAELTALIIPSAIPGESTWDQPTEEVSDVRLNVGELNMVKGSSKKLTATVLPWTVKDRTVTWTSGDNSVATVNARGMVAAVGNGTTTITATSNQDGRTMAQCTVTVQTLDITMEGLLQDDCATSRQFIWNVGTGMPWTGGTKLDTAISSATIDTLSNKAYVVDSQSGAWNVHQVDLSTGTSQAIAQNTVGVPLWDMTYSSFFSTAESPKVHAVYGNYFLPAKDPMKLDGSAFNLSNLFAQYTGASYLVAVASAGHEIYDNDGQMVDTERVLLLDNLGNVWTYWLYVHDGAYKAWVGLATSDLNVQFTGDAAMENMYSSMVVGSDGNLYVSVFTGWTSEIYRLTYDEDTGAYQSMRIGDAGADVWPVVLTRVATNTPDEGNATTMPQAVTQATALTAGELVREEKTTTSA